MALVYYILWLCVWLALTGMNSMTGIVTGLVLAILPDLLISRNRQIETRKAIRALPQLFTDWAGLLLCMAVLVKNIFSGALAIVRILLSREIEIEPCLVRFKPSFSQKTQENGYIRSKFLNERTKFAVLMFSPGVIPVDGPDGNGELMIHALSRDAAQACAVKER